MVIVNIASMLYYTGKHILAMSYKISKAGNSYRATGQVNKLNKAGGKILLALLNIYLRDLEQGGRHLMYRRFRK